MIELHADTVCGGTMLENDEPRRFFATLKVAGKGLHHERATEVINLIPQLLDAVNACLPDLAHYAVTHGAGPDRRLQDLENILEQIEKGKP